MNQQEQEQELQKLPVPKLTEILLEIQQNQKNILFHNYTKSAKSNILQLTAQFLEAIYGAPREQIGILITRASDRFIKEAIEKRAQGLGQYLYDHSNLRAPLTENQMKAAEEA